MKCSQTRRLLEREFDGRLLVEESFPLRAHLDTCPDCRALDHAQRVLLDAIQSTPPPPVGRLDLERSLGKINATIDSMPPAVRPSRQAVIRQAVVRQAAVRQIALRTGWQLAAAVLAFVLGTLAWNWLEPEQDTPLIAQPEPDRLDEPLAEPPEVPLIEFGELEPFIELRDATLEPSVALNEEDEVDHSLLSQRRLEVGEALLAARELLYEHGSNVFADEVEFQLAELFKNDWPVERIIAGLARTGSPEDSDPIPSLALRYLGSRSSRATLPDLTRALKQPELARAAIAALADAGEAGRHELATVFWSPELGETVLPRVLAAGEITERERVEWVDAAFRVAARGHKAVRSDAAHELLDVLTESGEEGARSLIALANHPRVETADLLDALEASPFAGLALAESVFETHAGPDKSFLLRAVARVTPRATFDWVVGKTEQGDLRPLALQALAQYDNENALIALLDTNNISSLREEALHAAFDGFLDRNTELVASLAEGWTRSSAQLDGESLFDLLIQSESRGALPALLEFLTSDRVPAADRELALIAMTELAGPMHEAALISAVRELSSLDRTHAALLLILIREHCGAQVVAELFAAAPAHDRARALDLVERCFLEERRAHLLVQLVRFIHYPLNSASTPDRS